MEQEPHQWVVHPHEEEEEEGMMEDGALIRKKIVTEEVTSFSSTTSSSSSSSNDSEHDSGTCSVVTAPDGSPVQKDEEVSEIGNGGENFNHVNGDKSDYEAVGLAQVAEFAGEPTNVEAISGFNMSQNMNSVYFDKQQGTSPPPTFSWILFLFCCTICVKGSGSWLIECSLLSVY